MAGVGAEARRHRRAWAFVSIALPGDISGVGIGDIDG